METADIQKNGFPKKGGIIKGFFFTVLIIILALLLLAALVVVLTGPERKQLERLEGIRAVTGAASESPEMKSGGAVIDMPEAALSGFLSSNVTTIISEIPDIEFLGLDIRLYDEKVDILIGVEGTVPRLDIRRKAVLGVRARIGMTEEGWLSVSPESAVIGRLPLPIGRTFRIIRRNSEFDRIDASLDPEENRILIDPEVWLSGMIPGMTIKSVRAVRGSLRIAIGIPVGIEESLTNIITAASRDEETLIRNLNEILPTEDRSMLESVSGLFSAVREHSASDTARFNGATVSYVEGRVDARWPGNNNVIPVDFGDKLPVGTRISCGRDSFAELIFAGDHIVKISENSEMTLDSTVGEGGSDTYLSLLAGKARVLVSFLNDDDRFKLTAFQVVMAVRGTDFAVSLSGRNQVDLAVLEGLVAVNDKVVAGADQAITVKKGSIGIPGPIDPEFLKDIEEELDIRTMPDEFDSLARGSIVNVAVPHVMEAATIWAAMNVDTQWEVQYVIEDYMAANPDVTRAVDDFFRDNGLEDRRAEFESLFE